MKTMLLLATLLWASAINKTFANDVYITPAVLHAFETTFTKATNVQWSVVEQLYKVVFKENDEEITAFFDKDGSLVASCYLIAVSDLPRAMQRSLKADAAAYAITEVYEVQTDDGTDYYATVQKGKETKVLKAGAQKWSVYKK